ncbi:MAG: hypothetical protein ABJB74_18720 [Gemmatimonas sp.]
MSLSRSSRLLPLAFALLALSGCAHKGTGARTSTQPALSAERTDPRVGLRAGKLNAGEAVSNLRLLSKTSQPAKFETTNSDIAFSGKYAIQGNYNGFLVWDISTPSAPMLATAYFCPASQNDISVYKNLLFVSGESTTSRLDCGAQGAPGAVNKDRLRGIRIFDIGDIKNPKYIGNVQTCRGSHTHTVLEDPKDRDNVYIYISGSSAVRPAAELPGCVDNESTTDPASARFRIEVIKVPLADPSKAAVVASPRIFDDLKGVGSHGPTETDIANSAKVMAEAKANGGFAVMVFGEAMPLPANFTKPMLDSVAKARGSSGGPTAADSAALRVALPGIVAKITGEDKPPTGPNQCHDITVYPAIGLAGGACEGYGLLLDIKNPGRPIRIGAVADSNFQYWHSATFNNDGTKVLFSDEWGGGSAPKCRSTDKHEWGSDAIFEIQNGKMVFKSYYKLPAPQTEQENCVAHNGSLIPIPGRDVMVQAWYQGGISVFDWTDPAKPFEIASFDRGPVDATHMVMGGSWSAYWYNGVIVSSEIARGLDIAELTPSQFISQNEIDAAKTVRLDYLNAQGQPKMVWPPSFSLAKAYVDQLERNRCLRGDRVAALRSGLQTAEKAASVARRETLNSLALQVGAEAQGTCDASKMQKLAAAMRDLVGTVP